MLTVKPGDVGVLESYNTQLFIDDPRLTQDVVASFGRFQHLLDRDDRLLSPEEVKDVGDFFARLPNSRKLLFFKHMTNRGDARINLARSIHQIVVKDLLALFLSPDVRTDVVVNVPTGTRCQVVEVVDDDWLRVSVDGEVLWAHIYQVKITTTQRR